MKGRAPAALHVRSLGLQHADTGDKCGQDREEDHVDSCASACSSCLNTMNVATAKPRLTTVFFRLWDNSPPSIR